MKNVYCDEEGVQLGSFKLVETLSYTSSDARWTWRTTWKTSWTRGDKPQGMLSDFSRRLVTDHLTHPDLRANLFGAIYAAFTSKSIRMTHSALDRCLLEYNRRTQYRVGLHSLEPIIENLRYIMKALDWLFESTKKARKMEVLVIWSSSICQKTFWFAGW